MHTYTNKQSLHKYVHIDINVYVHVHKCMYIIVYIYTLKRNKLLCIKAWL